MAAQIGMSVPGASDLGLGDMLSQQVQQETEEERKKRLAAMQTAKFGVGASSLGLNTTGYGAAGLGGMGLS